MKSVYKSFLIQNIRDLWRASPVRVLVPASAGVALAQCMLGLLALQAYPTILFVMFLGISLYATWRALALLYRLDQDACAGTASGLLNLKDLSLLFGPLGVSAMFFLLLAPGPRFVTMFLLVFVPHVLFLVYFTRDSLQAAYDARASLRQKMKVQVVHLLKARPVGYHTVIREMLRTDKLGYYLKRLGNINGILRREVAQVEDVLLGQN